MKRFDWEAITFYTALVLGAAFAIALFVGLMQEFYSIEVRAQAARAEAEFAMTHPVRSFRVRCHRGALTFTAPGEGRTPEQAAANAKETLARVMGGEIVVDQVEGV